jgi:hypothetical protein
MTRSAEIMPQPELYIYRPGKVRNGITTRNVIVQSEEYFCLVALYES